MADPACEINSRHHGEIADNFAFSGNREGVFIIEAGPVNIDGDISFRELVFINGLILVMAPKTI